MAITKIETVTVGSGGAASFGFSSIPATYTDLMCVFSIRNSTAADVSGEFRFNNTSGNFTTRVLYGTGSGNAASYAETGGVDITYPVNTYTANTFGNGTLYVPNYAGSAYKSASAQSMAETNGTTAFSFMTAGLWSQTTAINQLTFHMNNGTCAEYSSATLYGVLKGSSGGVTVS